MENRKQHHLNSAEECNQDAGYVIGGVDEVLEFRLVESRSDLINIYETEIA